jgi:hypothetical protein
MLLLVAVVCMASYVECKSGLDAQENKDKVAAVAMQRKANKDAADAKREYIRAEADRLKASADRKAELHVFAAKNHDKAAASILDKADEAPEQLPGKYLRSRPTSAGHQKKKVDPTEAIDVDPSTFGHNFVHVDMSDEERLKKYGQPSMDMPQATVSTEIPSVDRPDNQRESLRESATGSDSSSDRPDVFPLSVDMPDSVNPLFLKNKKKPSKQSSLKKTVKVVAAQAKSVSTKRPSS